MEKSGGRSLEAKHGFFQILESVLAAAVIFLLRNYFPKTWERIYVPFLVVGSVLTLQPKDSEGRIV